MDKQEILKKYANLENKLLVSKIIDKVENTKTNKKISSTDFLSLNEQYLGEKILKENKINNYIIHGGLEEAEKKIIVFYPEKLENVAKANPVKLLDITAIRIELPKELIGAYSHKDYLGACIKIGIDISKIGDIVVDKDGADILIKKEILKFALINLASLTRFSKSKITEIKISEIREKIQSFKEIKIIVPSMRLDAIVSELAKTSRNKAEELLNLGKVFVNFEETIKGTKQIKQKDIISIRGKGRFVICSVEGKTRNERIILNVNKYI